MTAFLVAVGAAVGAPLRYLVGHWLRSRTPATASAGTLVVNVLGSFVLGLAVAAGLSGSALALVGAGFCGALTTFSSFALEVWEAWIDEERGHAVANVVLSLALGVGAAWAGWLVAA